MILPEGRAAGPRGTPAFTATPLALNASKAIVQHAGEWAEDEAWQRQDEIVHPVFSSDDALEGARAFAEKREPRWGAR